MRFAELLRGMAIRARQTPDANSVENQIVMEEVIRYVLPYPSLLINLDKKEFERIWKWHMRIILKVLVQ